MFGKTAVRVYIVAAMIPLTWWGATRMNLAIEAAPTDMPSWTFANMPMKLGKWRGENDDAMDPKIAIRTGADQTTIVNRVYRDDAGHVIRMHTAMFNDPKVGVIHSPMTCYRSQGWEGVSESKVNIPINDELELPVSVSHWRQKNEKRVVVYWYQLGKHVLFSRLDLGLKVRWSLAGKPTWPAMIKVMMDLPVTTNEEDAETAILNFVENVAKWENQPEHRNGKGMLGVGTNTTGAAVPP
jgi:EpsI family protein